MDGDQWLAELFAPALRRDSLAHTNEAEQLRGQLNALHDCDVLGRRAYEDALRLLDEAVAAAVSRAVFDVRPPLVMPARTAHLRRVLAVGKPFADVDGLTFILTSVELWDNRIDVFLGAVPSDAIDAEDAQLDAALLEWSERAQLGLSGDGSLGGPMDRGQRLLNLDIRLRDDVGTQFAFNGGGAGGGRRQQWRLHHGFTPGLPESAVRLAVEIVDREGHIDQSLDVLE